MNCRECRQYKAHTGEKPKCTDEVHEGEELCLGGTAAYADERPSAVREGRKVVRNTVMANV